MLESLCLLVAFFLKVPIARYIWVAGLGMSSSVGISLRIPSLLSIISGNFFSESNLAEKVVVSNARN